MASNLLLAPEIRQAYERKLLQRFRTTTVFNKFGEQKSIPARNGVNLSWRRMEIIRPVSAVLTGSFPIDATYTKAESIALTEGTFYVPSVVASWAQVTATVRVYGQAAYISDLDIAQAIDEQIPEYVSLGVELWLN